MPSLRQRWYRWAALALGCMLVSSAAVAQLAPDPLGADAERARLVSCGPVLASYKWQVSREPDHPLIGKALFTDRIGLVDLADQSADELLIAIYLPRSRYVLLGEVHDNPDHHALRAAFLKVASCSTRSAPNAAVFEHFRTDQADVLPGPSSPPDDAATALMQRLDWSKSGWPDAAMFKPLFSAAYAAGLAIVPGEPPRGVVRSVAREGLKVLPKAEQRRLQLDRPLPQIYADALDRELKGSHCGVLPDSAVAGLALAQHYRDAHLADAMITAAMRNEKVFLLAGNGHVRSDRGVPWHLRQRNPEARVYTVMLIEVEEGRNDYRSYLPRPPEERAPSVPGITGEYTGRTADLIIFTPRVDRPDPCEQMRAMKR